MQGRPWRGPVSALLVLGACSVELPATSTTEGKLVAINVAEDWVNHWYYGAASEKGSNAYVHDDRTYWSDANPDAPGKYSSASDCSGFVSATMKRAYGYDDTSLNSWLCVRTGDCPGGRPLALAYYNAILDENHWSVIGNPAALAVGDMIAVKYTGDPNGNTGHVMWVDSQVQYDGTATDDDGATIYLYKVDIIDSSSTYHGTADLRNTIGVGQGVGRGTMHLFTYGDGDLAGYKWSTWSGSEPFVNGELQRDGSRRSWVVGGRYDNSGPSSSPPPCALASLISSDNYNAMFPAAGRAAGYTYDSFLAAACSYPGFGTTGDATTNKREIAAFLANVAHETSKLTSMAEEDPGDDYCDTSKSYLCPGGSYHGRGPLQLSWNYNYHDASIDLGNPSIFTNPDLLLTNVGVGWQTSLWFWMTSMGASYGYTPKTSHDAMTAGATPDGFVKTIRIINGGYECGVDDTSEQGLQRQRRITYYNEYVGILSTTTGAMDNALCPAW